MAKISLVFLAVLYMATLSQAMPTFDLESDESAENEDANLYNLAKRFSPDRRSSRLGRWSSSAKAIVQQMIHKTQPDEIYARSRVVPVGGDGSTFTGSRIVPCLLQNCRG